jgi:outer membrane cobalamin receptor
MKSKSLICLVFALIITCIANAQTPKVTPLTAKDSMLVAKYLDSIIVTGKQDAVSARLDKKTFNLSENISQAGGSVLEAMQNLPGITMGSDGKLLLRGSDKVMILIDGKQTALTGFGAQSGLGNMPASAIEKIEIINNPSAKYDAGGNAGIINIILKKEKKEGFNGKIGLTVGAGALWIKKENLPSIRPQYQGTPKPFPVVQLSQKQNEPVFSGR